MNHTVFQNKVCTQGKPLVVDFWAPWCAPCRMTKPVLEKLALEYKGKVEFLSVNADESREILDEYHISGIPTVIAFRDGKIASRITGARDEAGYRAMFEGLSQGENIKIPMRPFDRIMRLGGGLALVIIGIITRYWVIVGAGALLTFWGFHDRCPIWAAITRTFRKKPISE
jgi:thioredoxin 1